MSARYDPKIIKKKWQRYWEERGIFTAEDFSSKPKKYILVEFPYPSGDGLHVGHCRGYTALDVVARKSRMEGYNVLFPMGWDAFGLPTENYAIKTGIHPAQATRRNTDTFRKQLKSLGFSFDWTREINTTDPGYYRWTQWIFLQLYKNGLAYKQKAPINWCPSCKIGLANEEVAGGACERCEGRVERREMEQWMLRITAYADKLLAGLEEVDFPRRVKEQQKNWIGRSEGMEITYEVGGTGRGITCFTTRPDTNFGATFVVLAPEHDWVKKIIKGELPSENRDKITEYVKAALRKSELERQEEGGRKTGVFTGYSAKNTLTGEKMLIWVADFVLAYVGTGAVVGVPGHDRRDFDFAQAVGLPIKRVVVGPGGDDLPITKTEQVEEGEGRMVNSGFLNGLKTSEAKEKVMDYLEERGRGKRAVTYRLRDWVFSRQHYWGEPIPIIYCNECGEVPVPEEDLPVELPKVERYEPTDTGRSPLANVAEWVNASCPTCGGKGRRETDTMPNWAGSSWYYLRYTDPRNDQELAGGKLMAYWMPVDLYNGGMEHTTLHLLYSRFWHKFLYDLRLVPSSEPYTKRTSHGMVLGKAGVKMSKSRGNVINPDEVAQQFGADTLRTYEMFIGPFEKAVEWNTAGVRGVRRFFDRVWQVGERVADKNDVPAEVDLALQRTVKRVTEGIDRLKFNTAVAAMMEMLNELEEQPVVARRTWETFIILLSPFAPHLAEELWEKAGHKPSVSRADWPEYDEDKLAATEVSLPVQVNGRVRGEVKAAAGDSRQLLQRRAEQLANVRKYLEKGKLAKVIYVEGRMINFVVNNNDERTSAETEGQP